MNAGGMEGEMQEWAPEDVPVAEARCQDRMTARMRDVRHGSMPARQLP